MRKTDKVFDGCVTLLLWAAKVCHTDYNTINVVIFCIIMPIIIIGQAIVIVLLL
jgi:hypothetical protein